MLFRVAAVNTGESGGGKKKITWSRSVAFQTFESSNFSSLSLFLEAVDFKLRGKMPRAESLPLVSCRLEGEAGFWCLTRGEKELFGIFSCNEMKLRKKEITSKISELVSVPRPHRSVSCVQTLNKPRRARQRVILGKWTVCDTTNLILH